MFGNLQWKTRKLNLQTPSKIQRKQKELKNQRKIEVIVQIKYHLLQIGTG
jgi:hypothetical protein